MFCFKCGAEIPDESEFCLKCGVKMPKINNVELSKPEQENVAFTLDELTSLFGNNKIEAIKYVAHNSDMSLSEAKKYVDSLYKNSVTSKTQSPTIQKVKDKPLTKRQRIKENKKNGIACCPKCGSTSLTANKKGFGVGKAVVGAAVAGPIGLVAGNKGAKKVRITCLNCGNQWWA